MTVSTLAQCGFDSPRRGESRCRGRVAPGGPRDGCDVTDRSRGSWDLGLDIWPPSGDLPPLALTSNLTPAHHPHLISALPYTLEPIWRAVAPGPPVRLPGSGTAELAREREDVRANVWQAFLSGASSANDDGYFSKISA
ncbi:hypothetical protein AAFF_G00167030 [Aldrovandia affinis]|uniref:Uncharacterized protein n=1 Tax=Aldrovandia affinis TaxID=143900 RepID=A0AAD7RM81_9TELE|nr:hypothetical protein AAFF_G00167030 [Aldrovandia affinis]